MADQKHWDRVYASKKADEVSWFQPQAEQSLRLIRATGLNEQAQILDVGGGASVLVDDLIRHGYQNLTVLDLSPTALQVARERLGEQAQRVRWIEGDITKMQGPAKTYDIWHDRAVFHFLTEPKQREAYVDAVLHSVKKGGHVMVATFASDGPERCSGLPVMRYEAEGLHADFGAHFELLHHEKDEHRTPGGRIQNFLYCYCRIH